jgi:polysaccharide export outer membrane protein
MNRSGYSTWMHSPIGKCEGLHALVFVSCVVLIISGCSSSKYEASGVQVSPAGPTQVLPAVPKQSTADASPVAQNLYTAADDDSSAALEALWRERTAPSAASSGFGLGPGDVLSISVPMISQLKDRKVRVSEDGTIALPLLGEMKVAGMTEQDLRQELASRLGRYMYNPQVEVFLQTPENRVVSVLGMVKAPGRYMVASRSDSAMTLLSRAGGATELAGSHVLLFPALSGNIGATAASATETVVADASTKPALYQFPGHSISDRMADTSLPLSGSRQQRAPLVISMTGPERYLEMPVRPGDVLFVPAAGSVSVQGWVDKPGLFPITPGLTVLGSVAAAGGAVFSSSATLIRAQQGGVAREISLNLSKIKAGREPDVPVQGGDVVIVERTITGAIPYSLYFLLNRIGLGVPIVP